MANNNSQSTGNGEYISYEDATDEHLEGINTPQKGAAEENPPWSNDTTSESYPGKEIEQVVKDIKTILEINPSNLERRKNTITRRRGKNIGSNINLNLGQMNQRALLQTIAQIQIAQLSGVLDIADSVDALNQITVSGTNVIENAEQAQVVVPQSDSANIPTRQLMIQADHENTKDIYFGDSNVKPNSGFILKPGESMTISIDLTQDQLYMAASSSGPVVNLLGMV